MQQRERALRLRRRVSVVVATWAAMAVGGFALLAHHTVAGTGVTTAGASTAAVHSTSSPAAATSSAHATRSATASATTAPAASSGTGTTTIVSGGS